MKKSFNKILSVLVVLSMLLSGVVVSVNATTTEDDGTITIGFGTDCGYAYEYTANKVAFAADYIKITHNGSLITQGYFADKTPQGKKIEVPAGVYDVYMNVSSHYNFSVTVAGLGDSITSETFTDLTAWGTYTDVKIGTITTATGISADTITVRHNGNGEMLLKSIKLVPTEDIIIGIGSDYGYAYKLYGGNTGSAMGEDFAKLVTGNAALGYGYYSDLNPSGTKIEIPAGKYEVYAHFCSSDPLSYEIEGLGTDIISPTFTDVAWAQYKDYKLGEFETTGIDEEYITIRQTFDTSGSSILKYLKFVKIGDVETEPEPTTPPTEPEEPQYPEGTVVVNTNNTQTDYAVRLYGGVVENTNSIQAEYAQIGSFNDRGTSTGRQFDFGTFNNTGKALSLPAGRYEVYINAATTDSHTWEFVAGSEIVSETKEPSHNSDPNVYVDELIGTYTFIEAVSFDICSLRFVAGAGSHTSKVKYICFVPVDASTPIVPDIAVDAEEVIIPVGNQYGYTFTTTGTVLTTPDLMRLGPSAASVTYGHIEGQDVAGTKIVLPAGSYDVYANSSVYGNGTITVTGFGEDYSKTIIDTDSWGTYTDEKLGTIETEGVLCDNITIGYSGNGYLGVKYLKFVRKAYLDPTIPVIPEIPDDADEFIIPIGEQVGYAFEVSGGRGGFSGDAAVFFPETVITYGYISTKSPVGTKIVVPPGRFDIYTVYTTGADATFTISGLGDTFVSNILPQTPTYGTYVEGKLATIETDGILGDTITLDLNANTQTVIKDLKFVRNEIVYPGSTVALNNEVTLTAADIVGGEEVAFGEDNANAVLPEAIGAATFSVNAANAGRYELYANMTSESAMYSHTIVVNGEKQPSMNFNPKNGKNFLGYVDLNAGVNTITLNQNLGSVTLNSVTLRYERVIPADKEIIHLNGSDATIVGEGNTAVDTATGTLNLLARHGAGQYSITAAGGKYDVYVNVASTGRRGKIAFYADDSGFKSELDFGATMYHIPEYYSDNAQAYQNIYLGRYELAEGERTVTFKNPSDASHVNVHGGGPLYVRDIYFVKAEAESEASVINAITYENSDPYKSQVAVDLNETVEFDVSAPKAGLYSLDLYYGSEHDFVLQKYLNNPAVELYVNGALIKTASLTAPNEKKTFTLKSVLGEVYLNEGANTIMLKNVTTGTTEPTEGEDYYDLENCSDILYVRQLTLKPADAKIYIGEVADDHDWGEVEAGYNSEFSVKVDLNGVLLRKDITMIFAVYEDGVPVHIATKEYTVSGDRSLVYTIPADVATNEDATYEVKVMMWDDLEGIKPLNNAISY